MKRILVLGASGMLGHQVVRVFSDLGFDVVQTIRGNAEGSQQQFLNFAVGTDSLSGLLDSVKPDWIVNCIGIIKPYIQEANPQSVQNAVKVNADFSLLLAAEAEVRELPVVQIATDCVYSGISGSYYEDAPHDPLDVYGKSKSLGEARSPFVLNLRASIIGREMGRASSLVEWFLDSPPGAKLRGFSNHRWNGVTTVAFARVVAGIISSGSFSPGVQHLIPADLVTKGELLRLLARFSGRSDIRVQDFEADETVDRTLLTRDGDRNRRLWDDGGYKAVPTVSQLVEEMFA